MNWQQLIQALVDLNDGETIENDTSVVSAANLALDHLSRLLPSRGYISITQDSSTVDVPGKVDTSSVPGYVLYRPTGLALDLIALSGCPHTPRGTYIAGARLVDGCILLPTGFSGVAVVEYRRQHERVTLDTVEHNGEIDVQPGCEDLMTLAMAYYIWLEDEPTKAERFLQMFNAQAAYELRARSGVPHSEAVTDAYGWR